MNGNKIGLINHKKNANGGASLNMLSNSFLSNLNIYLHIKGQIIKYHNNITIVQKYSTMGIILFHHHLMYRLF